MVGNVCKDPMPHNGNCWFTGVQLIVLDNGSVGTPAEASLVIPTSGTIIAGDAALTNPQSGQSKGSASGAISGITIRFMVRRNSGPLNSQQSRFDGKVFADNSAGGTNDPNLGTINWHTKFNDRIDCSKPHVSSTTTAPPPPPPSRQWHR
jgi:hypothetical protein